jgi:hypothetical protein
MFDWLWSFLSLSRGRQEVRVMDVASGRVRETLDGGCFATFSPDGKYLALADQDGAVRLYDLPLRKQWFKIFGFAVATFGCAYALLAGASRLWRRRALARATLEAGGGDRRCGSEKMLENEQEAV